MSESNSFISVWEFPNVPFICKLKSKEEKRCGQDFYSTVGGQEESWNYSRVVALDGIWPQTFAFILHFCAFNSQGCFSTVCESQHELQELVWTGGWSRKIFSFHTLGNSIFIFQKLLSANRILFLRAKNPFSFEWRHLHRRSCGFGE